MDTSGAVDRLRRQAADKRDALREERRRQEETRMPDLKERDKKAKKSTNNAGIYKEWSHRESANKNASRAAGAAKMQPPPAQPAPEPFAAPLSPSKSQRELKKKAGEATNRLY